MRHAMPEVVPGVAPHRWELGETARAAARELARALPSELRIVSSDEPKALQTAEEIVAVRGGDISPARRSTTGSRTLP